LSGGAPFFWQPEAHGIDRLTIAISPTSAPGAPVKVKAEALDVQRQQPPSGPVTLHAAAPDARA
jgi:hypothetical protein